MQQIICWLERDGDDYRLSVEVPPTGKRMALGKAAVQEDCAISLRGSTTTLKTILGWLDTFDRDKLQHQLDEAGMYAVGNYLYQQTLGQYPQHRQLPGEDVDLRIISTCPHIHRLPWNMLAREGMALHSGHSGWRITLAVEPATRDVEWPALPTMLIIAPEPIWDLQGKRAEPTDSQTHIQALRTRLANTIKAYDTPEKLRVVTTWADLQRALRDQHFDMLYYYGHGMGDQHSSRLWFATPDGRSVDLRTFQELRRELEQASGGAPTVCYVNACFGNSGGQMGAGLQLGAVCAAVVANRTAAVTETAMRQGQEFLESLLLEARPPDISLQDALARCGGTSGDVRWVTPVLHRHYGSWKPGRKLPRYHLDRQDPHWEHRLDRVTHSGTLKEQVGQAVQNRSPATVCCLWYGCDNVGVDLFHQRVPLDLRALRLNVQIALCRMNWPVTDAGNDARAYEGCLLAGLRADETPFARAPLGLYDIPRFLEQLAGQTGKPTLLHLRLKTINKDVRMPPSKLKAFLEWWQSAVVLPILNPARIQTLMTLGLELPNPAAMPGAFGTHLEPLNDELYPHLSVYLLPQLPLLQAHDLREFIKRFFPSLPRDKANQAIDYILLTARGNYQSTLNLLTNLNNDAFYSQGQTTPHNIRDDWSSP